MFKSNSIAPECTKTELLQHPWINFALQSMRSEELALRQLISQFDLTLGAEFVKVVDDIRALEGHVITTGMGKSGHVARKIASTLSSTGTPAFFVHPAEAGHGDLGMIKQNDLVIALSWSGESTELAPLIEYTGRMRITLVAITSSKTSTLSKAANLTLLLPPCEESCPFGLAPTSSTLLQLALGDALAVTLLKSRGFSSSSFRLLHPKGSLGASLKQIKDIMHSEPEMPIVHQNVKVEEAITTLSICNFGSVIIVDDEGLLAGIVTDGDLRRSIFKPRLREQFIKDIMTTRPITVSKDMFLCQAIELQENLKITVLIVEESRRPIGLVHYSDLLKHRAL